MGVVNLMSYIVDALSATLNPPATFTEAQYPNTPPAFRPASCATALRPDEQEDEKWVRDWSSFKTNVAGEKITVKIACPGVAFQDLKVAADGHIVRVHGTTVRNHHAATADRPHHLTYRVDRSFRIPPGASLDETSS